MYWTMHWTNKEVVTNEMTKNKLIHDEIDTTLHVKMISLA